MLDAVNIAIIDDEKAQTELLEVFVKNWSCERNLRTSTDTFYSAESFEFTWSMNKKYDIILLDIQMSGQNGIELAKLIRKTDDTTNIIFITAITDYIQEGYDVSAINYLIKPISEEKLHQCLDRAISKNIKEEKSILFNMDGEILRVIQKDIIYIEAFAHSIDINTINNKYSAKKSISAMEKELDENIFIRCHRSYIVGLKYIKRIRSNELELDNGNIIPISRRQYSTTYMAFIKYFKGDADE